MLNSKLWTLSKCAAYRSQDEPVNSSMPVNERLENTNAAATILLDIADVLAGIPTQITQSPTF